MSMRRSIACLRSLSVRALRSGRLEYRRALAIPSAPSAAKRIAVDPRI